MPCPHVTRRITSPSPEIIMTTWCGLTPNITRSEDALNALVKRATKAKSDHVTPVSPRPWGWQLWQVSLLRRVMIVCCVADDSTQHPHTPTTTVIVDSWSCCQPLSHPFILGALIKWIQADTSISQTKIRQENWSSARKSSCTAKQRRVGNVFHWIHLFIYF